MASFVQVFDDVTKLGRKIPTTDYAERGAYPIIDQGQDEIAGYTDETEGLFEDVPAIIFGDHTRVIKYVDTPCFLGADGVKLLKAKIPDANYRYLYYVLQNARIPNTGYNRHFKWLKEVEIPLPDARTQSDIVAALDKVTALIALRKQQIAKLDELVKARFVEMFGDPVSNQKKWPLFALGSRCELITGNTPSRAESENYGDFIEWIKSDNINTPNTYLTTAQEGLSEIGYKKGRSVEAGSILMTCIAGSISCIGNVAIADRKVAFNQQINAIVPKQDEVLFLYWLMLLAKPIIHSPINMSLKGILSKGQLSEMKFPIPPLDLQHQFAAFVAQTDQQKLTIQHSLAQLELLKKALMQKYFG